MDRRSFLKAAAGAVAVAPVAAAVGAPAAIPAAIDANLGTIMAGTISAEQISAGAITASKISTVHYERGFRIFSDGISRLMVGIPDENDDLGRVMLIEGDHPHGN